MFPLALGLIEIVGTALIILMAFSPSSFCCADGGPPLGIQGYWTHNRMSPSAVTSPFIALAACSLFL